VRYSKILGGGLKADTGIFMRDPRRIENDPSKMCDLEEIK
jgi:hypothetical protein